MQRLLIVSRSHTPQGGADRIVADLCRELPRRGWNVVLGLTKGLRFDNPQRYREVHGELPIVEIDSYPGTRTARLACLRKVIQRVRPDMVLSMRVFDAYEAVARLKTASGPRLAVGIRAYEAPYLSDLVRYRENIDLAVTSGELAAAACRELCGCDPGRIVSVGGGIHPPYQAAEPRVPRSPLRLLYAGRLETHQKRALDLVGFCSELQALKIDFCLDIAGTGPVEAELREVLRPLVDDGTVRFLGWLTQDQLYQQIYPRADVFVHFAAWEGMTIAPREAMVHGAVPVMSRFSGAVTEGIFRDGQTALMFDVGDVRTAAGCVRRLLESPGLMERLSANAIESQQGKFSFDGSMDAWAEAFDRCMQMPLMRGPIFRLPNPEQGRLAKVPGGGRVQTWLRRWLRRPVQHQSPGSEWPTSSGQITQAETDRFMEYAVRCERSQNTSTPDTLWSTQSMDHLGRTGS